MLLWINGAQLPSNLLIRSKGGGRGEGERLEKKGRDGKVWRGMKKRRGGVAGCRVESSEKERHASTTGGRRGRGDVEGVTKVRRWSRGASNPPFVSVATVRGSLNRNEAGDGTVEC